MSHPDSCPKCKVSWNSGVSMPEALLYHNPNHCKSLEDAKKVARECYGWTEENDKRFGSNVTGLETPDYDGVSFLQCTPCLAIFDRFTMKEL